MAGYWIFKKNRKNSKFCLTASLPGHIHKPRHQQSIVQPQFYATATYSPVRCAFWGSDKRGASAPRCSFYLLLGSSSCNETISMCNFSYQHFSAVYLDTAIKCLHFSKSIGQVEGQVQIRYSQCKIQAKSVLNWV